MPPPKAEPIPMLAPSRAMAKEHHLAAHVDAASRVLRSGQYILGTEVVALEAAMAQRLAVRHSLAVGSGTDALLVALMALGIRPGDQVICPAYTFFATAGVIARLGALPVFVDVCPKRLIITAETIAPAITPHTRAIIPVHLFGRMAPMAQIMALAQQHSLAVVEDVAQAMGSSQASGAAGALGHVAAHSFFPSKNLGGCGDGGLITTNDADLHQRMVGLRNHGAGSCPGQPRYLHPEVGGNFRLDALQAALIMEHLPHLSGALAARRAHAQIYCEAFAKAGADAAGEIRWHPHEAGETINQFVVRFAGPQIRERVAQALNDAGIASAIYYPLPLHLQPCFARLGYRCGDLPHSEAAASDSLALPIAPELHGDEIRRVAQVLLKALRETTTTAAAI